MNQEEQDRAAEARFNHRQAEREENLEGLAKGIIEFSELVRRDTRRKLLHPDDGLALERIIGTSDLLEINFMDIGRRAARAIGRIQVRDLAGRVREFGTGFVVSPHLLLTNNHVLPSADSARRSLLDLDFEDDETFKPRTPAIFGLDP
jgi:endonuclease G, mitochondrial